MNSIKFLLSQSFDRLQFSSKCAIKAQGRPQPNIILTQRKRPTTKNPKGGIRNFQSKWYDAFSWLTACNEAHKLYCFPCLLFNKTSDCQWTSTGFDDLSNFHRLARLHQDSAPHKDSAIRLERLGKERIETSLSGAFREERDKYNAEVNKNRAVMERFVDVVRFLADQELGFRGHDETELSRNKGKYKELISLISKYDEPLREHLESSFLFRGDSKTIHNDIIDSLAHCVLATIKTELSAAPFVSVSVDETTDISHESQCAMTFRYLTPDSAVVERFVGFTNVSGETNAANLSTVILRKIDELGVGGKLVAQSYDGAATMSGSATGVQQRIMQTYPCALFVHCWAHKLNLVLQSAMAGTAGTKQVFATLEGLHSFFSHSPKRLAALHSVNPAVHVIAPSRTRWTFKSRVLENLLKHFETFISFFTNVADDVYDFGGEVCNAAAGYLMFLCSTKSRLLLILLHEIFSSAKVLFEQLQKIDSSIVAACRRVEAMDAFLASLQKDSEFTRCLEAANALTNCEPPIKRRKDIPPSQLRDVYFEIVRAVRQHIQRRFGSLRNLQFITLCDTSCFQDFCKQFPSEAFTVLEAGPYADLFDLAVLHTELELLYKDPELRAQGPANVLRAIQQQSITDSYREVVRLLQLTLTLPITTATCERTFSALKRIKTSQRNKINDDRLSSLAVIAIERDLASKVPNVEVINHFASTKNRKIPLHHK